MNPKSIFICFVASILFFSSLLYCSDKKKNSNDFYNEQTEIIINRVLTENSNTVDVGSYRGDMAAMMLKRAPYGKHWAVEPIPTLAEKLRKRFANNKNVIVVEAAFADKMGETEFNHVESNEPYSGIKKRKYLHKNETIKKIKVKLQTLDNTVGNKKIDLIKIDVEGAELLVLKGAVKTLAKSKPYVIFEHGKGASEYYQAKPEDVFRFFENAGLKINTMKRWIEKKPAYSLEMFQNAYAKHQDYYFIAYPN